MQTAPTEQPILDNGQQQLYMQETEETANNSSRAPNFDSNHKVRLAFVICDERFNFLR